MASVPAPVAMPQGMLFVGDNGNDGDVSKAIKELSYLRSLMVAVWKAWNEATRDGGRLLFAFCSS